MQDSKKQKKRLTMKRERAVWNDEEDELITIAKNSSTKAYGRKPLSQDYADNLRMEYQYVICFKLVFILF